MADTMRAARFSDYGDPEVVSVDEIPVPEPGPGQVLLKVEAASMNHLDLWIRRGMPIDTPMPHIGGSDMAGTVEAVGSAVEGVSPGTRVVVDPSLHYEWYDGKGRGQSFDEPSFQILGEHTQGGFAEYAVVPAANLLEIPEGVSSEKAAAAGLVGVTAWRALMTRGRLQAGERVLITGGSGGVSTMAIQIAKLAGATVHVVTSGADNVQRVLELGADVAYDRTKVDFSREVWRDTDKEGVDLVLDAVGQAVWEPCLRSLKVRGRLVTYGATTGARGATEIRLVFWKQLDIMGSTMGTPAEYRTVMGLVFDGKLDPVIHEVLPLEEARRAHELLEAGDAFGKLVLTP
jgi:NADPH2:quinone reductase